MQPQRVGLYASVSTAEQQTLPAQIAAMRKYADDRGWTIVATFEDIGSGAKERTKQKELIKLAKQRKLDVVLVWRLDRWSRSLADLIKSLEELTAVGVHFVSITEAFDFTTPLGQAMAGILGVFAQFERQILVERVKAGMAEAKRKGMRLGRPAIALQKSGEIRKLFYEGQLSKKEIARRLKVSRPSVIRILSRAA